MNAPRLQPATPGAASRKAVRQTGRRKGLGAFFQCLPPAIMLILMPKCPACFAAMVALLTGAGISLSTAGALRLALIVMCVASLAWLLARPLRRRHLRRHLSCSCVKPA